MANQHDGEEVRLAIELEPDLRRRIAAAAAERGMAIKDYVVEVLRQALDTNGVARRRDGSADWSRLSSRSFARDWDSDADSVYDDLA